jgi:hypothetical protein
MKNSSGAAVRIVQGRGMRTKFSLMKNLTYAVIFNDATHRTEWMRPWEYFLWKLFRIFWCVLMVSEALQSYSAPCCQSRFERVRTYLWSPEPWTEPTLRSKNRTEPNLNLRFGSSVRGSNRSSGPNFGIPRRSRTCFTKAAPEVIRLMTKMMAYFSLFQPPSHVIGCNVVNLVAYL